MPYFSNSEEFVNYLTSLKEDDIIDSSYSIHLNNESLNHFRKKILQTCLEEFTQKYAVERLTLSINEQDGDITAFMLEALSHGRIKPRSLGLILNVLNKRQLVILEKFLTSEICPPTLMLNLDLEDKESDVSLMLAHVISSSKAPKNLTCHLWDKISLDSLEKLAKAISASNAPNRLHLNLIAHSIGDEGANIIANILQSPMRLTHLSINLDYSRITDVGANAFINALKNRENNTEISLSLEDNAISDSVNESLQMLLTSKSTPLEEKITSRKRSHASRSDSEDDIENKEMPAKKIKPQYAFYHLNNKADIAALEKRFDIKYEEDKYHSIPDLFVAPLAILGEEGFSVYARTPIKAGTKLGYYMGEDKTGAPEKGGGGAYAFTITNDLYCDALKIRDWTAWPNHSETPNIEVSSETIDGKTRILFAAKSALERNESLTIDYGNEYFKNLGFNPFYLDVTDNWVSDKERLLNNINHYEEIPCCDFEDDALLVDLLGINDENDKIYLPKLSYSILTQDYEAINKLIDDKIHVNLVSYNTTLDEKDYCILPNQQEHVTPLMLAAYKGQLDTVKKLLSHGASVNRRTLITGDTAFSFLLAGKMNEQTRLDIANCLILHNANVNLININKLSLMDIAIYYRQPKIIEKLIPLMPSIRSKDGRIHSTLVNTALETSLAYYDETMLHYVLHTLMTPNHLLSATKYLLPDEFIKTYPEKAPGYVSNLIKLLETKKFRLFIDNNAQAKTFFNKLKCVNISLKSLYLMRRVFITELIAKVR